ncbi:hypothetical protein MnTg04_01353 [bacterium MnTg04]|nr:hypothetical protein MnTg04_01353 [bacterium MnTg04]
MVAVRAAHEHGCGLSGAAVTRDFQPGMETQQVGEIPGQAEFYLLAIDNQDWRQRARQGLFFPGGRHHDLLETRLVVIATGSDCLGGNCRHRGEKKYCFHRWLLTTHPWVIETGKIPVRGGSSGCKDPLTLCRPRRRYIWTIGSVSGLTSGLRRLHLLPAYNAVDSRTHRVDEA